MEQKCKCGRPLRPGKIVCDVCRQRRISVVVEQMKDSCKEELRLLLEQEKILKELMSKCDRQSSSYTVESERDVISLLQELFKKKQAERQVLDHIIRIQRMKSKV